MKALPRDLKYAFLDKEYKYCLVIINSELSQDQENKLLDILKRITKPLVEIFQI